MTAANLVARRSGSFPFIGCRPSTSIQIATQVKFPFFKVSRPLVRQSFHFSSHIKCADAASSSHHSLPSDNGIYHEPFWLSAAKDVIWGLRTLAVFLAEQPSQLKHIEWPTFQSTLKTATLTLVLVALLIIALSTIDATLSYMLAWMLRKSA